MARARGRCGSVGAAIGAGMVLLAVGAGAGCGPIECEGGVVGEPDPAIYADGFYDVLTTSLLDADPKGVGFAFSDTQGRRLGAGGCGFARTERGDREAFTATTHDNWGSISKMLTGIAAIHVVDATPGVSLDARFGDYLPLRWQRVLHPDYQPVTLRMLLQHEGGFDHIGEVYELDDDGRVVDLLMARLSAPAEGTVGVRSYSNLSPILLHFAIAYMSDPEGMRAREAELEQTSVGDDFSRDINLAASEVYVDYVQEHLLAVAGVEGSCNITDFPGHAYTYAGGPKQRRGNFPRQAFGGEHTDECSAGGWVLHAEGMLQLLATTRHDDTILAPASYALMENEALPNERLAYAHADLVEGGHAFCHGGAYQGIEAMVCSFPNGLQAVVNANSPVEGGTVALRDILLDAYEQSLRP